MHNVWKYSIYVLIVFEIFVPLRKTPQHLIFLLYFLLYGLETSLLTMLKIKIINVETTHTFIIMYHVLIPLHTRRMIRCVASCIVVRVPYR